jgi:hypothetical protein
MMLIYGSVKHVRVTLRPVSHRGFGDNAGTPDLFDPQLEFLERHVLTEAARPGAR